MKDIEIESNEWFSSKKKIQEKMVDSNTIQTQKIIESEDDNITVYSETEINPELLKKCNELLQHNFTKIGEEIENKQNQTNPASPKRSPRLKNKKTENNFKQKWEKEIKDMKGEDLLMEWSTEKPFGILVNC